MGLRQDLYVSRRALAGYVLIGTAWAIFFAQMPVMKANIGASDGVYGLVVLVASFGALVAMWLAPFAQRQAGPWAMPLAAVGVGSGMWLAASANGLVLFGLGMFIASAGSGVLDVLVNDRVATAEYRTGRPLMNLNHGLYSLAYALAAVATAGLREAGLTPSQVFTGYMGLCLWLAWAARGYDPQPAPDATPGAAVSGSFILIAGGVVLMAFLTEASTEGWSALHLERTLGGSAGAGALGPAVMGLTMGIGRLSGHALSRLIGDVTLMIWACLAAAVGLVLAGAAGTIWVAYLGFGIAGLGISVVAPLVLALVGRRVPQGARLKAISQVSVMGYGAFFIGPPVMGLVSEGFGLRTSFYLIAALLAGVGLWLVPKLRRPA